MIKKSIGTILILAGSIIFVFLISRGMIFPHIIGPIILVTSGVLLFAFKGKAK
jgi:hypothetical protein